MDYRITVYSVGELARLSGVTVRTLHHFDRIGLLCPRRTGQARYRRYGRAELERLQDILFYRAAGMALAEIALLLASPANRLDRLQRHKARLEAETERHHRMLAALTLTIGHLTKGQEMPDRDLYTPFAPEVQARHEDWLVATGGPGMAAAIATSQRAVAGRMPDLIAALRDIEGDLVAAMQSGAMPPDPALSPLLERHRALIARFWGTDCPPDAYAGLGRMYRDHPDFVSRFEGLAPGLSDWLPRAIAAHADRLARLG